MQKVIGFLLKFAVPILALAFMVGASYLYGKADGQIETVAVMQPQINQAVNERDQARNQVSLLAGKVQAYEATGAQVQEVRDELTAQAAVQQQQLMSKLSSLGLIMTQKKTGDECKDARQVAVEYFNLLKAQGGGK